MTKARRQAAEKRGRRSETFAVLLLRLKGYRILGRRVRTHAGEIDLIARAPSGLVCFIEVKARADEALAVDSVGQRQQGRIARAAALNLASRPELAQKKTHNKKNTNNPKTKPKQKQNTKHPGD